MYTPRKHEFYLRAFDLIHGIPGKTTLTHYTHSLNKDIDGHTYRSSNRRDKESYP